MSLTKLLGSKRLDRHVATANEISELRKLVQRDLKDAGVSGLSADRIFATAYNAALQLSKIPFDEMSVLGFLDAASQVAVQQQAGCQQPTKTLPLSHGGSSAVHATIRFL